MMEADVFLFEGDLPRCPVCGAPGVEVTTYGDQSRSYICGEEGCAYSRVMVAFKDSARAAAD